MTRYEFLNLIKLKIEHYQKKEHIKISKFEEFEEV
jgi:hypothetical protein